MAVMFVGCLLFKKGPLNLFPENILVQEASRPVYQLPLYPPLALTDIDEP